MVYMDLKDMKYNCLIDILYINYFIVTIFFGIWICVINCKFYLKYYILDCDNEILTLKLNG